MTIVRPTPPPILGPTGEPVRSGGALPWEGAPGGGGAEFTPADLANLEAWYRADDVITSGSSITTWTDKSGNGHNLTQATGTAQPTQVTRAGQAAASFDGGDWMQGAFAHSHAQPLTVYCVFEFASVAARQVLFDGDDSSNRNSVWNTPTPEYAMFSGLQVNGGTPTAATIHAGSWTFNNTASIGYVDDFRAGSHIQSGTTSASSMDGLTVGAQYDGSANLSGYLYELIVVTATQDAATRKQIGDYLTARYSGLSVTT